MKSRMLQWAADYGRQVEREISRRSREWRRDEEGYTKRIETLADLCRKLETRARDAETRARRLAGALTSVCTLVNIPGPHSFETKEDIDRVERAILGHIKAGASGTTVRIMSRCCLELHEALGAPDNISSSNWLDLLAEVSRMRIEAVN